MWSGIISMSFVLRVENYLFHREPLRFMSTSEAPKLSDVLCGRKGFLAMAQAHKP
jgi:hypothetical protein